MLHIFAGAIAFVVAPIALASAKGGLVHRRWGKIYFWAMAFVGASALVLAMARPTLFLALVSVFSFYLSFSGYRILVHKDGSGERLDWIVAVLTLAACVFFVVVAIVNPRLIQNQQIPGIVFGSLGILSAGRSISTFLRPGGPKMMWWYRHMGGMVGSYIAAWSAFSVNILSRYAGAQWWVWLWPTILGVPSLLLWIGYYRRRFASRTSAV